MFWRVRLLLGNRPLDDWESPASSVSVRHFSTTITSCLTSFGAFSPFSPSIIDVKYPTFTNNNRNTPRFIDINDPETILEVGINPRGHIYVVSHGFLESGDRPWLRDLMHALLDDEKNATVVIVDWKGGSSPPYYQAVANIRLCGAITAHLIYAIYVSQAALTCKNF